MNSFTGIMVGWIASLPVVFLWVFFEFNPTDVYFGAFVLITFVISLVIGYPLCAIVTKRLRRYGKYPSYGESALLGGLYGIIALLMIFIPIFTFAAPVMLMGYFPATIAAAIQGSVAGIVVRRQLQS